MELITKTSRKRYGSASALIFSFFLLFLTNFKWNMNTKGAEPLPLSLQRLFIETMGEEVTAQLTQVSSARPRELEASSKSNMLTQASWLLPTEAFWWA